MQNAADFLTLIHMPVSSQNFSTLLRVHWRFLLLLARAARSSAKARAVIHSLSLLPYLKPLPAFSSEVNRGSITILNNIGDSGFPCFTPRNIGIWLVFQSLSTCIVVELLWNRSSIRPPFRTDSYAF